MASVKIILRSKANKNGTHALAIQIIKDRRKSVIHLGQHVRIEDWDSDQQRVKKSHPNSARLNNFLIKKLAEANDRVLEIETQKNDASVLALKRSIKPSGGGTFFAQAEIFLERLKVSGKYNQYNSDKPRIKHFREFIGHDIAFQDITPALLERFKAYLMSTRPIKERTAVNALVAIRSVFSQAIRDNITDAKYYPFGKGKVKIKYPDSIKIGLIPEEVEKLEDVELTEENQHHARNVWLISFYFAGMRVSDVLRMRWTDIQDGRLHYTMGKNNKGGSLKVPDKASKIIEQYRQFKQNADDLVFPDLKGCDFENKYLTQQKIAFRTNTIDKALRTHVASKAGIDKKLTMHIARHTFGNISGEKIPIQMLQKLYRHTSITTTIGYQANFIHKSADDALETVLTFK